MKAALLDVSVLFALIYEQHERHRDVHTWFGENHRWGWATCTHTQLSVIRLLSSNFAADLNLAVPMAAALVRSLCSHPSHQYWNQEVVPSSVEAFQWDQIRGRNQLPDLFLLAIAVQNNGILVTLDRKIGIEGVTGARLENLVVL